MARAVIDLLKWYNTEMSEVLIPILGRARDGRPVVGYARVSERDYDSISSYRWYSLRGYAYAVSAAKVAMHRLILDAPPGTIVDHIDRDPLNNTRENLRFVNPQQSAWNTRARGGVSRYKGVILHKGRWRAQFGLNGHRYHLVGRECEDEAARDYDWAISMLIDGEYAVKNFPEEIQLKDRLPACLLTKSTRQNIRPRPRSGYRGVKEIGGRFQARVCHSGKQEYLGMFPDAESAARAVDRRNIEIYGDNADLNFPQTR